MKIIRVTAIWCMSCLSMKRTWKKVFEKYPELEIIDLDYDTSKEEVQTYNIGKILPELIVFKDNKEVKRIIGETSKKELNQIIEVLHEKD